MGTDYFVKNTKSVIYSYFLWMIKLVLGLLGSVLSSKNNLGSIYSTLIK